MDDQVYYTGLREARPYLPPFEELTRAQRKYLTLRVERRRQAIQKLTDTLNDIDNAAAASIYKEHNTHDTELSRQSSPSPRRRFSQADVFWGIFERIGRSGR